MKEVYTLLLCFLAIFSFIAYKFINSYWYYLPLALGCGIIGWLGASSVNKKKELAGVEE